MSGRMSKSGSTEADYVVVGAGSAGCAVASRLAAAGAEVILVEAGGSDTSLALRGLIDLPGAVAVLLSTPRLKRLVDWGFKTVPQEHAEGRTIPQTRGRILGGSSSVNGMLFVRGHRRNFDDWAADGCAGWSFADVLPAFRRLEDWEDGATELRGAGGPIRVRRQPTLTDAAHSYVAAAAERLGLRQVDDYNGECMEGVGTIQLNADGGRRWSSARGYLRDDPAASLTVVPHSTVTRVLLEGSRAVGVELLGPLGHDPTVLRARREVVVSAGAFGSPQLLMLSGIGPAAHLREHGIAPVADLPVGENLHDHLFVPVSFRMDSALRRPTPTYFARGLAQGYLRRGTGWASHAQFETTGFARSSYAGEVPDLQLLSLYWVYPIPNQDSDHAVRPPTRKPGQSIFPTLIYPESRGSVRLASADPSAPPLIDPAYLAADRDADVLLDGIEMVREVMAGTGDNQGEIGPGPHLYDRRSLRAVLPRFVHSVYHPVGTCRMGSDERAVVDERLRVRGVDNLRVADASVMPSITGGNTNAPTMMIGERCAEFMLAGSTTGP